MYLLLAIHNNIIINYTGILKVQCRNIERHIIIKELYLHGTLINRYHMKQIYCFTDSQQQ